MIKCIILYPNGNLDTKDFKTLQSIKELLGNDLEEFEHEYWNIKFKGYAKKFDKENPVGDYSPMGSCLFEKDVFGTLVIPYITPVKSHFLQEVHTALYEAEDSFSALEVLQMETGRVVYKQTRDTNLPILRKEDGKYVLPLEKVEDLDESKIFLNRSFLESRLGKHYRMKRYLLIALLAIMVGAMVNTLLDTLLVSILISLVFSLIMSDICIRISVKRLDELYQKFMLKILEERDLIIGKLR